MGTAGRWTTAAGTPTARVEFLGCLPRRGARGSCWRGARALLFPGEEDFGIVPVEAQAAGVPVIAYGVGGARDTVLDGATGLLFGEQSVAASRGDPGLRGARWDPDAIRANARRFGPSASPRPRRAVTDAADVLAARDDAYATPSPG